MRAPWNPWEMSYKLRNQHAPHPGCGLIIDEDAQEYLMALPDSLILYWQVLADGTAQPVVQPFPAEWLQ